MRVGILTSLSLIVFVLGVNKQLSDNFFHWTTILFDHVLRPKNKLRRSKLGDVLPFF